MLNQLSIGVSGMRAAQIGLDVTGNNIANANTPGYRRQSPIYAEQLGGERFGVVLGGGVTLQRIRQARALLTNESLLENKSALADTDTALRVASQIESRLNPPSGSLADRYEELQASIEVLAASPFESAARRAVVAAGSALTRELTSAANDLAGVSQALALEITDTVDEVNQLAAQVADLNTQIQRSPTANALIDKRNQLVERLSERIDVRLDERNNQVTIAGGAVVIGTQRPRQLEYNGTSITVQGDQTPLRVGGSVAGLLTSRHEIVPQALDRLHTLAEGLVQSIDTVHFPKMIHFSWLGTICR